MKPLPLTAISTLVLLAACSTLGGGCAGPNGSVTASPEGASALDRVERAPASIRWEVDLSEVLSGVAREGADGARTTATAEFFADASGPSGPVTGGPGTFARRAAGEAPEPMAFQHPMSGGGGDFFLGLGGRRPLEHPRAATETWRVAGAAVNATTLSVGDEDELPLLGVEATAWVDGFRARVLLDCVYENDRDRQLEGTFKLRLPEGASPYYFAFGEEVWAKDGAWTLPGRDRSLSLGPAPESVLEDRAGHWKGAREARLVPRGEAARAYQEVVRRSVDPALMEWAGAGVFQARVFPLRRRAVHRVVVGYEVDLVPLPGSDGDRYQLTLDLPEDVPALSVDLNVLAPLPDVRVSPLAAESETGSRRTFSWRGTAERSFRVEVRGVSTAAIASSEDDGYFAMQLPPALALAMELGSPQAGSPVAVFAVDTSLSSASGRYPIWIDLMEAILTRSGDTLREFAVVFFDVAPRWWRPELTTNTGAAVAELRAYAESLALEGASDLGGALDAAAHPAWDRSAGGAPWSLFLLSDGASTWGSAELSRLSAIARGGRIGPVFAYSTGTAGTDRAVLEHLVRETGGALFSVTGPSGLEAAAVAHHTRPWTIEGLRVPGVTDLLLQGRPTRLFAGQSLRVVGRGRPVAGTAVELDVVRDGRRETLAYPIETVLESALAPRAYGEVATAQIEAFGRVRVDAARAYATRFRVPGKACSLLMLENDAAYHEQGFLPPEVASRGSSEPAAPIVADALRTVGRVLEEPTYALLGLLEPLVSVGRLGGRRGGPEPADRIGGPDEVGAARVLDEELVRGLARLPRSALEVSPESLEFEALRRDSVPAVVAQALASGAPVYALVQEEAARRREELAVGDAVRVLSCLVEREPGDGVLARDVAQTLIQWGLPAQAYHLFLRVAESRPFEPQSYLSLARCAEEIGKADLALFWYTVALDGRWDPRFGEFHRSAAFDALRFFRRLGRGELQVALESVVAGRVADVVRSVGLAEADVVVAIEWNTNATDVDLHVVEPSGEHCFYGHQRTVSGARLSTDVTQGFGPELYVLPDAPGGDYTVFVHYFADDPNRTAVRTKVLATVYLGWGTDGETLARREVLLDASRQEQGIAVLSID